MNALPSSKIFSILFGVVYITCFYMDWALFRFYPETARFHLQMTPEDGPAILWYGWLALSALVSLAVALVVPRKLAERIPDSWAWIVPVVVVVGTLIYERRWFVSPV